MTEPELSSLTGNVLHLENDILCPTFLLNLLARSPVRINKMWVSEMMF